MINQGCKLPESVMINQGCMPARAYSMWVLVGLVAASSRSPMHNLTRLDCKLGSQVCAHQRLATHLSQKYLDTLQAFCHLPPANHRACSLHRHLSVPALYTALSARPHGELHAAEELLDTCEDYTQAALCSLVKTHPAFTQRGRAQRARQEQAEKLTKDCLDWCPRFQKERDRAARCLKPLTEAIEAGMPFNRSTRGEDSICAHGDRQARAHGDCHELSIGEPEALRTLQRGDSPTFQAFRICTIQLLTWETTPDKKLQAIYAIVTNPVGYVILLILMGGFVRCYGLGVCVKVIFGVHCSGTTWYAPWRERCQGWYYRYQPVIMQTLRDCTTQVAKHDWCFWLRGLAMMHAIGLGLKFIIGIICLIAFVRYGGGLSG
jgi:hypothetical protein